MSFRPLLLGKLQQQLTRPLTMLTSSLGIPVNTRQYRLVLILIAVAMPILAVALYECGPGWLHDAKGGDFAIFMSSLFAGLACMYGALFLFIEIAPKRK